MDGPTNGRTASDSKDPLPGLGVQKDFWNGGKLAKG